jgi:hypothetical protein
VSSVSPQRTRWVSGAESKLGEEDGDGDGDGSLEDQRGGGDASEAVRYWELVGESRVGEAAEVGWE